MEATAWINLYEMLVNCITKYSFFFFLKAQGE